MCCWARSRARTTFGLGFLLACLACVEPSNASCTLSDAGAVPLRPPAAGEAQAVPVHAVPAFEDGFFLLYPTAVEFVNVSSGERSGVASTTDVSGENAADYTFTDIHSGTFVPTRDELIVVDGNDLLRIDVSGDRATFRRLRDLASRQYEAHVSPTHNDTHVLIAGQACVGAVDLRLASDWKYDEVVGECGRPSTTAITSTVPSSTDIGDTMAVSSGPGGLGVWTSLQLLGVNLSAGTVTPYTTQTPPWLEAFRSMGPVPGQGFGAFPGFKCDMLLDAGRGIPMLQTTVGFDSALCGPSSNVIGFNAASTGGRITAVVLTGQSARFVNYDSCQFSEFSTTFWAGLNSVTPTPTTSSSTGQPTTTPTPTPDGAAVASDSSTDNTVIIAVSAVVGLIVVVGIIAAAVVVTRTNTQEVSSTPAANEPVTGEPAAKDPSAVDTIRSSSRAAAHDSIAAPAAHDDLRSSEPGPPVARVVRQRATSHGGVSPAASHQEEAGNVEARRSPGLSASQAASTSTQGHRMRASGRQPSEMMSVSEEKRHLSQSAPNGVVVSAVSRGDFDRSMQDTDEGLKRKLGLRAWSDAELRRHNRRCAFVRESQYQRGKLLGRGANGSVYAVLLHDGSTIAMKEAKLMGDEDEIAGQMAEVENEMGLLSALHHDNLVTYYGVVCDESRMEVALFMENVTGGSLAALVRGMDATLPESMAQLFTKQMLRGLAYIHQAGIVHRDLKCDNVLRDAHTGTVKLADFGTAKRLGNAAGASRAAQTMIGTPYFMAPEILEAAAEEGEGYGSKADIWSIGILVGELLNRGNAPWPAFPSPAHAFMHILNKDNAPELPAGLSEHCEDFVRRCTRRDPRERPSAVELLEHPWILLAADDADDDLDGSIGGSTDPFEVSRNSHPTAAATAAPS